MADFSNYTLPQLFQLQKDIDKTIEDRKVSDKHAALVAMKALAEERGFDINELLGLNSKATKVKSAVVPQYRNPADPSSTWTGRGRKPLWVLAHLENGGQLSDLKI